MSKVSVKVKKLVNQIKGFLDEDEVRYSMVSDTCIEVYIQAENVNLVVLIYVVNEHIIVRAPEFIRNVKLRSLDILSFMMKTMNEVLDIRLEIDDEGKSLSSCCQHIVEDNTITKSQFDFMMMVVIRVTDDIYPKLMQMVYSCESELSINGNKIDNLDDLSDSDLLDELDEELEDIDNITGSDDKEHKIN